MWVRCLENNQLVITSGFPTVNFRKMREIQILNILSLFMAMKEHMRYKADTLREVGRKLMFSYLDFRCYFKANSQNHIHFPRDLGESL